MNRTRQDGSPNDSFDRNSEEDDDGSWDLGGRRKSRVASCSF